MTFSFVPNNDGSRWFGMIMTIDLNGSKSPNVLGLDVFELILGTSDKKTVFRDYQSSRATLLNDCKFGGTGQSCGALIMKDGWKISDDYPWK